MTARVLNIWVKAGKREPGTTHHGHQDGEMFKVKKSNKRQVKPRMASLKHERRK